MAQLTTAFFQKIISMEGGYQAHAADNGNYCNGVLIGTKYGMSAVAVQTWWGRCPTVAEMQGMTLDTAFQFYASWYFDRYNLFKVENQQLFELLANNTMGSPSNAAKVEQRVLNSLGYSVAVDGVRGSKTLAALNDAWKKHGASFYNEIRRQWVEYLLSLNRPEFQAGWIARMEKHYPNLAVGTGIGIGSVAILLFITYILSKR
jgi:Putative secretion activating protein